MADKTFVKITNKEIYEGIEKLREQNQQDHLKIISRLDRTNGKVKLNRWIATTALTLAMLAISLAIKYGGLK